MLSKHAKKQYILLISASFFLFLVLNNPFFIKEEKTEVSLNNETENEEVSPIELFNDSYKVIKRNYWDKHSADNELYRFKIRYANQIKDEEDAKVAINTMLASLNDPYSKFFFFF